jgi:hypothetical protein
MNNIIKLIAIVMAFFFVKCITLNSTKTKNLSLFQKEFRKGRIAC